jgi:hypothetical protein
MSRARPWSRRWPRSAWTSPPRSSGRADHREGAGRRHRDHDGLRRRVPGLPVGATWTGTCPTRPGWPSSRSGPSATRSPHACTRCLTSWTGETGPVTAGRVGWSPGTSTGRMRPWPYEDEAVQQPTGSRRSAARTRLHPRCAPGISSPVVTDPQPMIMGPLIVAASAAPAARTTPSGRLVMPDLSWTAARFGLVPVRDGWLDNGIGVYLTASEYLAPYELTRGHDFDPSAWAEVLLRLHPGEVYITVLAALNRASRFRDPVFEYQERFLRRLGDGDGVGAVGVRRRLGGPSGLDGASGAARQHELSGNSRCRHPRTRGLPAGRVPPTGAALVRLDTTSRFHAA